MGKSFFMVHLRGGGKTFFLILLYHGRKFLSSQKGLFGAAAVDKEGESGYTDTYQKYLI